MISDAIKYRSKIDNTGKYSRKTSKQVLQARKLAKRRQKQRKKHYAAKQELEGDFSAAKALRAGRTSSQMTKLWQLVGIAVGALMFVLAVPSPMSRLAAGFVGFLGVVMMVFGMSRRDAWKEIRITLAGLLLLALAVPSPMSNKKAQAAVGTLGCLLILTCLVAMSKILKKFAAGLAPKPKKIAIIDGSGYDSDDFEEIDDLEETGTGLKAHDRVNWTQWTPETEQQMIYYDSEHSL